MMGGYRGQCIFIEHTAFSVCIRLYLRRALCIALAKALG